MKTIVPFKRGNQDDDATLIQTDEERSRLLEDITESNSDDTPHDPDKGAHNKHFWKDIFG